MDEIDQMIKAIFHKDFRFGNFEHVDFKNFRMFKVVFREADFTDANIKGTDLHCAKYDSDIKGLNDSAK